MSQSQAQKKFQDACQKKQQIKNLSYLLQETIMYMDFKIRKDNKSFTLLLLCGGRGQESFKVDKAFQKAFCSMKSQEKIEYFCQTIELALEAQNSDESILQQNLDLESFQLQIVLIKGEKQSAPITILIEGFKIQSQGSQAINLDVKNYLLRKSKKKNKSCYVLQAIKKTDPEIIRFSFLKPDDEKFFYPKIRQVFVAAKRITIQKSINDARKRKQMMEGTTSVKQNLFKVKIDPVKTDSELEISQQMKMEHNYQTNRTHLSKKTICEQMIKNLDEQDLSQDITDLQDQNQNEISDNNIKFSQRLFKSMVPGYCLDDIGVLLNFGSVYQSQLSQLFVYRQNKNHMIHKMQMKLEAGVESVCRALYNVQLQKIWHPEIEEGQVTMKITSENSCVVYLKQRAYSEWYRPRDYLILLHLFRFEKQTILVGRSIQNARYPPFQSITRGKVDYIVWKIQKLNENTSKVAVQLSIDHQGVLNKKHQEELTLRFLKGFEYLETYLLKQKNVQKLQQFLSFNWVVSEDPNQESVFGQAQQNRNHMHLSLKTVDFEEGSEMSIEPSQFYSIEDLSNDEQEVVIDEKQSEEESEHELQESNVISHGKKMLLNSQVFGKDQQKEQIKIGEDGCILLPTTYLRKKHILQPFEAKKKELKPPYKNIVTKNDWEIQKSGGLKLINQEKIEAQRNVSKFIMKTMKKNLFSGKSVLSISLPVEIFNSDSNLQRLCASLALGPQLLEKAAQASNALERFKFCLAFGLSSNIFFFDIDKPFNPILGETYQGFIRGCPIYAQQISHHPPISSVFLVGRGYRVMASLQGKVSMGMNSGQGVNEGLVTIVFDDKSQVKFHAPPAQISGLNMGDIKYNFKGKSFFVDQKHGLFCEMKMEESGGYFSKKKRDFIDQISGQICRVDASFLSSYMKSKTSPAASNILEKLGQLSGRWPINFKIDEEVYYDVQKDLPDELQDDIYPLPSNSNYRQDLFYRKLQNLSKSQLQKQRLEGIQRADKKLRQKFNGKGH